MLSFLFDGWAVLGRTLAVGICSYAALVLILRVSGKRTLSKMNAFDFIVTVALGSTLATVITSSNVSIAQGLLALGLLVVLQVAVAWLSVRSGAFRRLTRSVPALLVHEGRFLRERMRQERVTEDDIRAALRTNSILSVEEAYAVVLETDGTFSVSAIPTARPAQTCWRGCGKNLLGSPFQAEHARGALIRLAAGSLHFHRRPSGEIGLYRQSMILAFRVQRELTRLFLGPFPR